MVSSFALEIWAGLGALVELDKDGSGTIDRSELAAALRRRLGEEPSEVCSTYIEQALLLSSITSGLR